MNDGGAAFPGFVNDEGKTCQGMSLRDWLAGLAMQAMVIGVDEANEDYIVPRAYVIADAMLSERAKAK